MSTDVRTAIVGAGGAVLSVTVLAALATALDCSAGPTPSASPRLRIALEGGTMKAAAMCGFTVTARWDLCWSVSLRWAWTC